MNRRAFTLGALLGIPAAAAGRALGAPRCPPPAAKCAMAEEPKPTIVVDHHVPDGSVIYVSPRTYAQLKKEGRL
jgi:hypothetical protein